MHQNGAIVTDQQITVPQATDARGVALRQPSLAGRTAVAVGMARDNSLHHIDEQSLFPFAQMTKRGAMRRPC